MLKSTKFLIGGASLSVAAAGTMAGLYGYEVSQRTERIENKYLQSIFDNINHIRTATGLAEMSDDFGAFKDQLIKDMSDKDTSLKQEVVTVIEATVTESKAHVESAIDSHADYTTEQRALLKAEIDRLIKALDDELVVIKNGIVGDHDINYYKTVIEDSVGASQFDDLSDDVTTLDADLQTLQSEIDSNKTTITNVQTQVTSSNTAIAAMKTKITDLQAAITTLQTSTSTTFKELDDSITALRTNLTATQNEIGVVKNTLDNNTATISSLQMNANQVNSHLVEHNNTLKVIETEVNAINTTIGGIQNQHTSDIATINSKLALLKAEDANLQAALVGETDSLKASYTELTQKVEKQKQDILDLVLKYNNMDASFTTKIDNLKKYFVDEQSKASILTASEINKLELLIMSNTTEIDKLKADIATLAGNQANIEQKVNAIDATLIQYNALFSTMKTDIAEAIDKTDQLEVALRNKIDANEAKILGLDTRIAALENAPGAVSNVDLIYDLADKSNRLNGLTLWTQRLYMTGDIKRYRKLDFLYYDAMAGKNGQFTLQIDKSGTIIDYDFGNRLHPNRIWMGFKVDYTTESIHLMYSYQAGVNSSTFYNSIGHFRALQIYGIK